MFKVVSIYLTLFLWSLFLQICLADANQMKGKDLRQFHIRDLAAIYKLRTWGEWESWSECSKSCGGGFRKRGRECIARDTFKVVSAAFCMWKMKGHEKIKKYDTKICNFESCFENYKCYSRDGNSFYFYDLLSTNHYAARFCCNKFMELPISDQLLQNFRNRMTSFDRYWFKSHSNNPKECSYVTKNSMKAYANCSGLAYILCLRRSSSCPEEAYSWSEWEEWSRCGMVCGGGTIRRRRHCLKINSNIKDKRCEGPDEQKAHCSTYECPGKFACFNSGKNSYYFFEYATYYSAAKKFCKEREMVLTELDTPKFIKRKMKFKTYWAENPGSVSHSCFYFEKFTNFLRYECNARPYYHVACRKDNQTCHIGQILCYHCSMGNDCTKIANSVLMSHSVIAEAKNKTLKMGKPCEVCVKKVDKDNRVVERSCMVEHNKKKCNHRIDPDDPKRIVTHCCAANKCNRY